MWIYTAKYFVIKIFGDNHVIYYLRHPLHKSISFSFLIVVQTGFILKSFIKTVHSCLHLDQLSNPNFHVQRYLYINVLSNRRLALAVSLPMYSPFPAVTSFRS